MKRLVYLFPAVVALALPACGDDVAGDTDGDESTGGDTGSDPTGSPTTDPTVDPTTSSSSTTDPTIDPDTGGSSEDSGGPMCDADDECVNADDCDVGQLCTGCFCLDDPNAEVCPGGWGEGQYVDCGSGEACGGDLQSACAGGPDDSSTCVFLGCETECDCPQPPEGFEGLAICEDTFGPGGMLDGINDCFLDCSGGEECPDGMFCAGDVCYVGEEPPPPKEIPNYGDCVNVEGLCEDGTCLVDDTEAPTQGICGGDCTDIEGDSDCDAPATGDAVPDCIAVNAMLTSCVLPCDGDTICPDDTICGAFGFCTHTLPPVPGFEDCATLPDLVCGADEACIETTDETNGSTQICSAADCVDPVADCPLPPETGDAPVACQDIDGEKGDECVLDCSADQTCPDGAVCTDDGYCAYVTPSFTLEEDFEGGTLPAGWTVHDVDGNTPAMQTAFVDDAWVVSDTVGGPNFSAVSTSWYMPAGQSDDWLISPAITLGAVATLNWTARATDPGFSDGYQVFVVPTSVAEFTGFVADGDPTDFLALDEGEVPSVLPVFEIANEETTLQIRSADLSALAGQEVHVAFRNNSDDLNVLLVDNITVTE